MPSRIQGSIKNGEVEPVGFQQFFLTGPFPNLNDLLNSAKNDYSRKSGRPGNRISAYEIIKRKFTNTICMNLRIMDVKPMRQAFFFFVWQEKDKRRDPDNISSAATKFILDAMVRSKLLDNDGWNQVKGHCHKYITSKGNPGVSISMIDPALHPEKLQEYYELIIKDLLNVR